ncbi:MAG TPA: ribonuclease HII [Alphaproteobacteria bacterium]|nr:ribonuclease HII [Alphaproteobacteria bacterium]
MTRPDFSFEKSNSGLCVGLDEAGCGPWAGPVMAGAVCFLSYEIESEPWVLDIHDSKKLSVKKRERLFSILISHPLVVYGVGIADVKEIDSLNIARASCLAMERAFQALSQEKLAYTALSYALVDGTRKPNLSVGYQSLIKGDSRSLSIAAASIIAKVTRDTHMQELAKSYPEYGWEKNAAYGTKAHIEAIEKHGITPHHRVSYKPIAKYAQSAA